MVIQYIRYKIDKEKTENFIAAYKKASEELDNSTSCLGYELTQCAEEPERFILRIEWASMEEHLNGFRKTMAFMRIFNHVGFFFDAIEEMNHYHLTDITSKHS